MLDDSVPLRDRGTFNTALAQLIEYRVRGPIDQIRAAIANVDVLVEALASIFRVTRDDMVAS